MTEVLLALTGTALSDDVARCGAAAGYRSVQADPLRCRPQWLRAGAVVVDGAALEQLVASRLPAREGVLVVGARESDADTWRRGLAVGAQGGFVLPAEEARLVAALSSLRRPHRAAAPVLCVVGGHGGVGTSTFAAVLAETASRQAPGVLLLDVEPGGAGLDLLLGMEATSGLRWNDITGETGSIAGPALAAALPRIGDRLRVVTRSRDDGAPLSPETVLAVLDAARTNGETVIADLGRAVDPAAQGVLDSADLVVVLTAASVPGVAATRKLLTRLALGGEPVRSELGLVVRGPAPGGLTAEQVADAVGVRLVTTLRTRRALARRCEEGGVRPPAHSPEVRSARVVLELLDPRRGVIG
ncbi:MAG: septum site-determining protein Ssd [Gordonia sp. (in: high G+C Gram-positive bacteria)]|uniref:septum site-determining protein Ssd n=1 Tax=Gordonia sp. (in: high G+C Gram-positive bacteria) TaxID=84139 RepID=UPI003BB4A9D3